MSRLVKEHQDKQSKYKEQQEKKRKEALAAVHKLTQTLVEGINLGVETAYENWTRSQRSYFHVQQST